MKVSGIAVPSFVVMKVVLGQNSAPGIMVGAACFVCAFSDLLIVNVAQVH